MPVVQGGKGRFVCKRAEAEVQVGCLGVYGFHITILVDQRHRKGTAQHVDPSALFTIRIP